MLDLFPVELREPVWYILAGFILGFAVSTLWEWLYFRRYRADTYRADKSRADGTRVETQTHVAVRRSASEPDWQNAPASPALHDSPEFESAAQPASYRSPPVFLTRERKQTVVEEAVVQQADADIPESEAPDRIELVNSGDGTLSSHGALTETEDEDGEAEQHTAVESVDKVHSSPSPIPADSADSAGTEEMTEIHDAPAAPTDLSMSQRNNETTVVSEQNRDNPRVPRSRGYPDELTKIHGIGDVYKRRLYAANIFTFHHVATSDIEVLRRATLAAPNANVESWPAQAEELAQKYQRSNASYSGPIPENLQEIPGIGPYFAQQLYRSGICTFEQLADTSLEELRSIFPPSVLGREMNLQQVLDTAQQKATERNS